MKKTYLYILSIIILIIGFSFVYSNLTKPIKIVGGILPPFEYYHESAPTGINIEFTNQIFDNLGKKYTIKLLPWEEAINQMKFGEADMMLSVLYNKEREAFIEFTEDQKRGDKEKSLWIESYGFFQKKNNNISALSNPKDIKLGIVREYAYWPELFEKEYDFYLFTTEKEGLEYLNHGIIDFMLLNKVAGSEIVKTSNLQEEIEYLDLTLKELPNYIVFSKDFKNKKFKENFYNELVKLKQEGYHEELYETYFEMNFTEFYRQSYL